MNPSFHSADDHEGTPGFGVDVGDVLSALWSQRRLIVLTSGVCAVVAAGVLLLRPNVYDAQVTLVPNEAQKLPGGLDIGKATDLAQAVGIRLPGTEGSAAYEKIIGSRRVRERVLERRFYDPKLGAEARLDSVFLARAKTQGKGKAAALRWLGRAIAAERDPRTGVWTVTVRHRHPETAAGIANALVEEAEHYERAHMAREARETRQFIENRIDSTRVALRDAENALRGFHSGNVRIGRSADLLLEEGRLVRDTRIQEEVFLTLTKQHELAKINEAFYQQSLVVLDWAEPPVYKAGPMRMRSMIVAGFLGLTVGCLLAIGRRYLPRAPAYRARAA